MPTPRKLRLNLQDLLVESFDSKGPAAVERRTVFGRQGAQEINAGTAYEGCIFTPDGSCAVSCFDSCTCESCYWREGRPYYVGC
ncbi:MAG TPA: hypothetical protein VLK84_25565 [Longimicrobium sp.]|nr:hypothetical protein [Longimicrobium sp.]